MERDVKAVVRERYRSAALRVAGGDGDACGPGCCGGGGTDPITRNLYDTVTTSQLPEAAVLASLGCGNPTALAELRAGEVVLDLGSGGGIDVLLSARRVGPTGHVYGLDMTDEMLALARRNAAEAGAENVTFLKGEIEAIPLPDASVDVIISNCVINLAADKARVLAEAFRVLVPGGRFGVSDIIAESGLDPGERTAAENRIGCAASTLTAEEYRHELRAAGFTGITITATSEAGEGLHTAIVQAAKPTG